MMQNEIIDALIRDLQEVTDKPIKDFVPLSASSGVYVYKCAYDGAPAVIKYFEKERDRREILNYKILKRHNIPAVKIFALGTAALVMEDITASEDWRLGEEDDTSDTEITKSLASWYFTFHENGACVPELNELYSELDSVNEENLKLLKTKLPAAADSFDYISENLIKLRWIIKQQSFTLTYNDFHWSNFIVRKDKKEAMMFDHNLLGRGYRFSDFRNVCWSMNDEAKASFVNEYNRLYFEKHGCTRENDEKTEMLIDNVTGPIHSLVWAYTERENFPDWAVDIKNEAVDGTLLEKAKRLLLYFNAPIYSK